MLTETQDGFFLDITALVCPMTFVRAKLTAERLIDKQLLEVRLRAGEPLANVPRSLVEHGYKIISCTPEDPDQPTGVHRLVITRV